MRQLVVVRLYVSAPSATGSEHGSESSGGVLYRTNSPNHRTRRNRPRREVHTMVRASGARGLRDVFNRCTNTIINSVAHATDAAPRRRRNRERRAVDCRSSRAVSIRLTTKLGRRAESLLVVRGGYGCVPAADHLRDPASQLAHVVWYHSLVSRTPVRWGGRRHQSTAC